MKLLPIQVASNALKYMPSLTPLTVLLTLTPRRNYLRFSNLGPKCDVDELELVFDEGYRGGNADNTVGMGVGLSEVQLVMDMHYDWLETTCDVYSEASSFSVNSVEYSEFCLEVTYLPEEKTRSALPDMSEIREKSQVILLHNSFNLIENIIAVSNVFHTVNLKDDMWKEQYNVFRTYLSCFQDDVKYCQYLYNDKDVSKILGNRDVLVDVGYIAKKYIANIICTFFPEVRYDIIGHISPVNTSSCMYSVMFGLLYQLISTMPANVTVEFSFMDKQIHIKCEDWCFEDALNGFDSEDADRFKMYRQMLEHMKNRISVRRDVVELIFN
jgi:hypothetical protein